MYSLIYGGVLGSLNMLAFYINCRNDPENKGTITGIL